MAESDDAAEAYQIAKTIEWPPSRAGVEAVAAAAGVGICSAAGVTAAAAPLCGFIAGEIGGFVYTFVAENLVARGSTEADARRDIALTQYVSQPRYAFDASAVAIYQAFPAQAGSIGNVRACMFAHWSRSLPTPVGYYSRWLDFYRPLSDRRRTDHARAVATMRRGRSVGLPMQHLMMQEVFAVTAACTAFYQSVVDRQRGRNDPSNPFRLL